MNTAPPPGTPSAMPPATDEAPRPETAARAGRTLALDTLIYGFARVIPGAVNFLLLFQLAWYFSPDQYGEYAVIAATAIFVTNIAYRWLSDSCVRFSSETSNQLQLALVSSVVALAVTAAILLYLALQALVVGTSATAWLAALLGIAMALELQYTELLRATGRGVLFAGLAIGTSLGRIAWALAVTHLLHGSLLLLVGGFAVAHAFSGFAALIAIRAMGGTTVGLSLSPTLLRSLLQFGIPLIGIKASNSILAVGDRIILDWFRTSAEVGIYTSAYQLGENSIKLVGTSILMSSAPLMFRKWASKDYAGTQVLFEKTLVLYLSLSVPLTVILSAFAPELTSVVLPKSYQEAGALLPWILAGAFFLILSMLGNRLWELSLKTRQLLLISLCPMALNVGLNLIFVPHFGPLAAAVNTTITYVAYSLGLLALVRRELPFRIPWRELGVTLAACAVGVAVGKGILMLLSHGAEPSRFGVLLAVALAGIPSLALLVAQSGLLRTPRFRASRSGA